MSIHSCPVQNSSRRHRYNVVGSAEQELDRKGDEKRPQMTSSIGYEDSRQWDRDFLGRVTPRRVQERGSGYGAVADKGARFAKVICLVVIFQLNKNEIKV